MPHPAVHIHSTFDARRAAKKRLPWMIFDYIDGAAGDETGAARWLVLWHNLSLAAIVKGQNDWAFSDIEVTYHSMETG
jgi:isopentenyl diphosphate isomerase/L-lactate dehydrogenase-like FMN-dependent dehydrogenase